jgi:hypothetical protein
MASAKEGIDLTKNDREAIRLYRLAARKGRESVGKEIGRSARWLRRVEFGCGGPAIFTAIDLSRLAKALDIHPEDLVSGR